MKKGQMDPDEWSNFSQIITGKNVTRRRTNKYVRDLIHYNVVTPLAGDKLICLTNEEKFAEDEEGEVTMVHFINGGQAVVRENAVPFRIDDDDDLYLKFPRIEYDGRIICGVTIICEPNYFKANYDQDYARAADVLGKASRNLNFDYAYAITVHKAQGSEWDRVLLADDGMMFGDVEFRKRWLYTAVTRAKSHLTWIQAWQG
jgi:exodeoxyribonuclease-5